MREIKFRVWNPTRQILGIPFDIFEMTSCHGEISQYPAETIFMQFTGLKDRNGIEIYEGDILQFADENGDSGQNEIVPNITNINKMYHISQRMPYWPIVKVIGNIYENPELLTPL